MYNHVDYAGINSMPYPGGKMYSAGKNENFTEPLDLNKFRIPNQELSIARNISTDNSKSISDREFVEWVENISKVKDEDLRKKMSNSLFLHLVSIFTKKF